MRIGLLGGSFNPIHNGHLKIAQAVWRKKRLNKVLFVVAKSPPHKPVEALASARDRFNMVREALLPFKHFEASDIELRRRGISYTIDTVRRLQRRLGHKTKIYFIIGTDTIPELSTWKDIEELANLVRFVCVNRKSFPVTRLKMLESLLGKKKVAEMRREAVRIKPVQLSATDVRRRLASGESVRSMLPPVVEEYIYSRRLYGARR